MTDLTRDLAFDVIETVAPEERSMLDAFYEILIDGVAGAAAGDIEAPGFGQIGAGLENDICRQVVTVSHVLTRSAQAGDPEAAATLALRELWKRWCRLEHWLGDCGGPPSLVKAFQEALLRRGAAATDEAIFVSTAMRLFDLPDPDLDDSDNVLARALRFDPALQTSA